MGEGCPGTTAMPGLATGLPAGPDFCERAFLMCMVSFPRGLTEPPPPAHKVATSCPRHLRRISLLCGERNCADEMK